MKLCIGKKKKKDPLSRAFKRSPDIRDLKTGHVTGSATFPSLGRPWKLFSRFGVGKVGVGPSLGSHSPSTPFCLHRVCGSSTFCCQMFILSEDPSPLGGWRASRLALPDGGVGWGWGGSTPLMGSARTRGLAGPGAVPATPLESHFNCSLNSRVLVRRTRLGTAPTSRGCHGDCAAQRHTEQAPNGDLVTPVFPAQVPCS